MKYGDPCPKCGKFLKTAERSNGYIRFRHITKMVDCIRPLHTGSDR